MEGFVLSPQRYYLASEKSFANTFILVMSTIPKRKYKRSDIEANYQNETKTF